LALWEKLAPFNPLNPNSRYIFKIKVYDHSIWV
jgi:hypothetical protein